MDFEEVNHMCTNNLSGSDLFKTRDFAESMGNLGHSGIVRIWFFNIIYSLILKKKLKAKMKIDKLKKSL
jgi:hypothetical protein